MISTATVCRSINCRESFRSVYSCRESGLVASAARSSSICSIQLLTSMAAEMMKAKNPSTRVNGSAVLGGAPALFLLSIVVSFIADRRQGFFEVVATLANLW